MAIYKTEAIVLKKFDFRETSLIVHFYTRDFGRISGLLKGIRKEPAKFASTLESFSLNEIVFYKKSNTNLHLVSQCDLKDNFDKIRQNMIKIGSASVLADLVHSICAEEDPHQDIFDLCLDCLREMEINDVAEKIMTIFKIKILALSGFKPHFDSCVSCGNKVMGHSKFSVILGGLLCPQCLAKDLKARSVYMGTVASILHIEKSDFRKNLSLGMNPQIKKELNFILNAFLDFHLGKRLKSEDIVSGLKAV